jgi:hypothetical protein
MKLSEITASEQQILFEAIDADNDTEFNTADLVKIVESVNGHWSDPMSGDEFMNDLKSMLESRGIVYE